MNYFSKIKPVLNKLSELNVYDSLEVVRAYMQASADGNTNRAYVPGVNHSEANSVEVWFADFLIANIIKYCGDFLKEDYFTPKRKSFDEVTKTALDYLLSQISKPLPELKRLCKDYCSYDEDKLFGFFNDAPHVKYPLIKDKGGYFCTIPKYITTALLDGLYYRLDIPNSGDPDVNKEISENMENYLGLIFEHFLNGSKVKCRQEITYDAGKRKTQRTSDWILWDDTDICFMDCKTKRISVKGKQAVTVDDEEIERVVRDKPFSSTRKKKEIDEVIPEGLTKDLIHLGMGVGKVFVSYDDYKAGNVSDFPYMEGKTFHAVIVTLEESLSNTPGYKDRIIKVAQSYREFKNGHPEPIDEKTVKMLSVKNIEECACVIAKEGIGYYLEHHMDNQLMAQKFVKDKFLLDKCNEELINPFLEEMKEYYGK